VVSAMGDFSDAELNRVLHKLIEVLSDNDVPPHTATGLCCEIAALATVMPIRELDVPLEEKIARLTMVFDAAARTMMNMARSLLEKPTSPAVPPGWLH
jgi:hypothetical protein